MKFTFYVLVLLVVNFELFAQYESDRMLQNKLAASQYFLKDSQQALESSIQQVSIIKQIAENNKKIKENNIQSDINNALKEGRVLFCAWREEKIDNGFNCVDNVPGTKEMLKLMRKLLFVLNSVDPEDQNIRSSIHKIYGQDNLKNLQEVLQASRKNLKANSWLVWYSCSKKTVEYTQTKKQEQKRVYDALGRCLFPELQSVAQAVPLKKGSLESKATSIKASAPIAMLVQVVGHGLRVAQDEEYELQVAQAVELEPKE